MSSNLHTLYCSEELIRFCTVLSNSFLFLQLHTVKLQFQEYHEEIETASEILHQLLFHTQFYVSVQDIKDWE